MRGADGVPEGQRARESQFRKLGKSFNLGVGLIKNPY